MLRSSFLVVLAFCVIFAVQSSEVPTQRSIINPPQNEALVVGPRVQLNCEASSSSSRVLWNEYARDPNGVPISSGGDLLTGNPNYPRYDLDHPNGSNIYNLAIEPTVMADGGTYQCIDISDSSPPAYAQLVILDGLPNCTTNIPESGYVREDVYYSVECIIGYNGNAAPKMTWTGPDKEEDGYWGEATTTTDKSVWSGVNMEMTRYFSSKMFSVKVNFTSAGFILPNSATNIPTWSYNYSTAPLYVQWVPQSMYRVPEQESYELGQTVECFADGNPGPTYFWRNLETQEQWEGNRLYASSDLVGTQRMLCRAQNTIDGVVYSQDYFFNFTVNELTTTPTTTPPTTTTPPPAEAPCDDLTGRWTATSPWLIDMCIEVDNNRNGRVIGLVRNSTDPYFIEVRGRVSPNKYDQIGMAGTWPVNIGTMAFNGICNKCYGVEKLQMTAIARKPLDNPTCEDQGPVYSYADYAFSRTGPPCREVFKQYNIQL